jgi:hypothetical protein
MAKLVIPHCDVCFKPMDSDYFFWNETCVMNNRDTCIRCRTIEGR